MDWVLEDLARWRRSAWQHWAARARRAAAL